MKESSIQKASLLGLVLMGAAVIVTAFIPKKNQEVIANGKLLFDSVDCGAFDFTCKPGEIDPDCDYTYQDGDLQSHTTMFFCTSQDGETTGKNNTGTEYWYGVFVSEVL